MPKLGGHAAEAFDQVVAADHAPADPGADGDVNDIVVALPGSVQPFARTARLASLPIKAGTLYFFDSRSASG